MSSSTKIYSANSPQEIPIPPTTPEPVPQDPTPPFPDNTPEPNPVETPAPTPDSTPEPEPV